METDTVRHVSGDLVRRLVQEGETSDNEDEEDESEESYNPWKRNKITLHFNELAADWSKGMKLVEQCMLDHGMLVIEGMVPTDICDESRRAMMRWLEGHIPGFRVEDPASWQLYNQNNITTSPDVVGMMNDGLLCVSSAVIKPRANPNVLEFFEHFYAGRLVEGDRLRMELDGAFWDFAPEHYPGGEVAGEEKGGYWHWRTMW